MRSSCTQRCPAKCMSMQADEEGFYYPVTDLEACINCGACERVCPNVNGSWKSNDEEFLQDIFGARAKDDKIRFQSSSGGIFSLLARHIIENGGTVYGALMSEDCTYVYHKAVESEKGLELLRGSKYVQSRIENIYIEAEEKLKYGVLVLFSGTPCQVAGLKYFLGKDYENLFCVEVICHGVPSELLWKRYLSYVEKKYHKKVMNVYFRSKKYSWKEFGSHFKLGDSKEVFKFSFEDPFFRMFNSSYSLRQSCYECHAKGRSTSADITIGDFWKIETIFPEFDDNKGISLVVINTEKGQSLIQMVKEGMVTTKKISYATAEQCNPPISQPITKSKQRNEFYKDLAAMSFKELKKKYAPFGIRSAVRAIRIKWRMGVVDKLN